MARRAEDFLDAEGFLGAEPRGSASSFLDAESFLDGGGRSGPPDYSARFNTKLAPDEEQRFEGWRAKLPKRLQNMSDYDLRGAWKAGAQEAANGHLPDRFKKPNHPTFSDESIYSGVEGAQGGHWSQDANGKWTFTPGATNLETFGREGLLNYFQRAEPDSTLSLEAASSGKPDSWAEIGKKLLQNAPTMLKQAAGGFLEGASERLPQIPQGMPPPRSKRYEEFASSFAENIAKERAAGKIPGQRMFEEATRDLKENAPDLEGNLAKRYSYEIAQAVVQMAPAIALGIATRGAGAPAAAAEATSLGLLGGQVYGQKYGEARAAGRTPEQATADASFYTAAETIPETIPLGVIMKPGGKFLARVLKSAGAEGLQEMFTEALEAGYDSGVLDESMTWGDAVKRIAEAGIVGAGAGGALAAGAHPFTRERRPSAEQPPPEAPEQDTATRDEVTAFAEQRRSELAARQDLTPAEQAEHDFLSGSPSPEAVAAAYDVRIRSELTPEDRASPIPDDLIAEGKGLVDEALSRGTGSEGDRAGPSGVVEGFLRDSEGLGNGRRAEAGREQLNGEINVPGGTQLAAPSVPSRDAAALETPPRGVDAATEPSGDLASRETALEEGPNGLLRDRPRQVLSGVRRALHEPEVLRAVIQSVPVDVVNNLVGQQVAADRLLHEPNMLLDRLAVPADQPIPTSVTRFVDEALPFIPGASGSRGTVPRAKPSAAPGGLEAASAAGASLVEGHTGQPNVPQQAQQRTEEENHARQIRGDQEKVSRGRRPAEAGASAGNGSAQEEAPQEAPERGRPAERAPRSDVLTEGEQPPEGARSLRDRIVAASNELEDTAYGTGGRHPTPMIQDLYARVGGDLGEFKAALKQMADDGLLEFQTGYSDTSVLTNREAKFDGPEIGLPRPLGDGLAYTRVKWLAADRPQSQDTFPVSGYGRIPRALAEEAYAGYKKAYPGSADLQSLDKIAARGGFGTEEMDRFAPGWRERAETAAAAERPSVPTTEPVVPAPVAPSSDQTAEPPLRIESYTDKSIIVRGQTRENIDRIKAAIPGRKPLWNRKAGGWVFPKAREQELRQGLEDLLQANREPTPEVGARSEPGPRAPSGFNEAGAGSSEEATTARRETQPTAAAQLRGEKIDDEWTAFAKDSGTLGIPRDQMPQIKAEHRGALANFLKARGIEGTEEMVLATSLKPTQREFSEAKVEKAKTFTGGDRAILVSSDGYVLDGHHQWLAKADKGEEIRIIRLDAPIRKLLTEVAEFPSVETAGGGPVAAEVGSAAPAEAEQQDDSATARSRQAKPRLAESADELYRQIVDKTESGVATDRGILYPVVVVPAEGAYSVRRSGIYRIENGGVTATKVSDAEADRVHDAINKDQAIVQVMTRWGGSGRNTASKVHEVIHSPSGNSFAARAQETVAPQARSELGDYLRTQREQSADTARQRGGQPLNRVQREAFLAGFDARVAEIEGTEPPAYDERNDRGARRNAYERGQQAVGFYVGQYQRQKAAGPQGSVPATYEDARRAGWKFEKISQSTTGRMRNQRFDVTPPDGPVLRAIVSHPKEELPSMTELKRRAFEQVRTRALQAPESPPETRSTRPPQGSTSEPIATEPERARATPRTSARGSNVPQQEAPVASSATPSQAGTIEDFGEHLAGARKELYQLYRERLEKAGELDVTTEPLSRSWPEPDYQKLLDEGADPWTIAFIHAARDEIPTKPQKTWKLKGWAEQVRALRDFSARLLSGDISKERLTTALGAPEFSRLRSSLEGRIDLYRAVGHEKSLKGVRLSAGHYSMIDGKALNPPKIIWTVERAAKATAFSNWPARLAQGDTRAEAIENFKRAYSGIDTQPKAEKQVRFEIYSYRTGAKAGKWIIGKKIGKDRIDLREFDTVKEARAFMEDRHDELVNDFQRWKNIPDERRASDSPRVGVDHRNGADVTPEQFSETFAFRGVQFGNYVEGTRRQADLNEAYDALMDLAGVLNVPPKALSLNGELGLAFGARGRGGKRAPRAHYESGTVVINLTKRKGAGSLAHEWWHAADNYFARQRGPFDQFLTEAREGRSNGGARPELLAAFRDLVATINQTRLKQRSKELDKRRSNDYWSTGREISARAFESYVIAKLADQGQANDYLANIVSEEMFELESAYPYPTASEIPAIRAAFDALFDTIETRETERGVEMFEFDEDSESALTEAPEFLRWFGDWKAARGIRRMRAMRPIDIPSLQGEELAAIRRAAEAAYREQAKAGPVRTVDGHLVHLTAVGLKKTRSHSADVRVMKVLPAIRGLLRAAEPLHTARHARMAPGDSIRAWHYYGAKVRLDGKEFFAKLVVRESVNGEIYYDNDLSSIEEISGRGGDATPAKPEAAPVSADRLTLADLAMLGNDASAVVDEQGHPRVVYHGTQADISAFRDRPTFFAEDPNTAAAYAGLRDKTPNIVPVYLSIQRPLRVDSMQDIARVIDDPSILEPYHPAWEALEAPEVRAALEKAGYDGARVSRDMNPRDMSEHPSWVAFRPNQIKSAIGNRGTFDSSDARIAFEFGDLPEDGDGLRAVVRFSPAWDKRRELVLKDLRAELHRMGLGNIELRAPDAIDVIDGRFERVGGATGHYGRGMIDVALQPQRDHRTTLRHEAIHALRELGLFRSAEWRTLVRAATSDAERMTTIRRRYAKQNLAAEQLNEEAVAHLFADWEAGGVDARGFVRTALERIRAFLEALANALRGNGFQTADDVFERIDRGEVGRRQRQAGTQRGSLSGVAEMGSGDNLTEEQPREPEGELVYRGGTRSGRYWTDSADVAASYGTQVYAARISPRDAISLDEAKDALADLGVMDIVEADYGGDFIAALGADDVLQVGERYETIAELLREQGHRWIKFEEDGATTYLDLDDATTGEPLSPNQPGARGGAPSGSFELSARNFNPERARKALRAENFNAERARRAPAGGGGQAATPASAAPVAPDGPPDTQLRRFFDEAIFRFQDKFNYLHKAQKAAARRRGLAEIPEAEDAYLAELRYHGMTGAAIEDFQREHVEPLVKAISEAGLHVEDVDRYLHARHAPEANAQLRRINPERGDNDALSGMSDEQAAQVIEEFKSSGQLSALEEIGRRVDAITKAQRELLVSSGLESADTVAKWEETYEHYVPLHREGFERQSPGRGKGFSVTGRQKRRAGSNRAVEHILAHVVSQYETTVVRAQKNRVGQTLLAFAQNNPNPELFEIDKVEHKPSFDAEGLVTYRPQRGFVFADNVLVVKVEGQDRTITFNDRNYEALRIARAMKNLAADHAGAFVNALTRMNRFLAIVNTGANPEFIISNFARDLQTAGYNLSSTEADRLKWRIIKDVGKAWRGIRAFQKGKPHAWAEHFDAFRKAGAQTGWMEHYRSIADREKRLVRMVEDLRRGSSLLRVKRGLRAVEQFIEHENTAVENAIRLSAFVHAREAGLSEGKASRIAKELTVNFNRKGDYGQVLNAMYLFYNASIQGSARVITAAAKSSKVRRLLGATIVAAMFLDMLNRALGGEDDDGKDRYDKIPDYVKERNLIIMLPEERGDYLKIPLPWGYNVFHVIGQVMGEALTKRNFKPSAGASRVFGAALSAFNPIGSEATLLQKISPTITDPLVQWAENKDWKGTPLRPSPNPFDVQAPNSQQFWDSVRAPSRWVAEKLNELTGGDEVRPGLIDVSPEVFDLIIDTFAGGAGRFVADALSLPAKAIKGEEVETYEVPMVRRLYGAPGAGTLRQEYNEHADAVRVTELEYRHYKDIGDLGKVDEIRRDHGDELALVMANKRIGNEIAKLKTQRKRLEAAGRSADAVNERIKALMNRFNQLYNERVGE